MIERSMSEDELKSAPPAAPVIDDETYAFVQEVFQLARADAAERLKNFLKSDSRRTSATEKAIVY